MAFTLVEHHLVVEGGGAVGIEAVLSDKLDRLGRDAAAVSGGNVRLPMLLQMAGKWARPSQ